MMLSSTRRAAARIRRVGRAALAGAVLLVQSMWAPAAPSAGGFWGARR